jgi:hypothetical protein
MKKEDQLIHIKLGYSEAIESKRDILITQTNLIKILKNIKRYHLIRSKELKLKIIFLKKIRDLKKNINKIEKAIPKIKIPEEIRHDERNKDKENIRKIKNISGSELKQNDIEKELAELQKRLSELK